MNYNIGIFRRCEAFFIRTHLEQYDLLPLDARLLALLREHPAVQEELGLRMDMDKGRIAKSISLLEEKHLICRQTNPKDKRQKIVALTDEGLAMMENISRIFQTWDTICYADFSQEERELHQSFLKRMTENAVEYRRRNGATKHDTKLD